VDGVTFEDIERDGLERWLAEADLEPTAYGYRPGRAALEAVQEVLCVIGRPTGGSLSGRMLPAYDGASMLTHRRECTVPRHP
jgi:hypothetical protein